MGLVYALITFIFVPQKGERENHIQEISIPDPKVKHFGMLLPLVGRELPVLAPQRSFGQEAELLEAPRLLGVATRELGERSEDRGHRRGLLFQPFEWQVPFQSLFAGG